MKAEEPWIRAEFHVHTKFSPDSLLDKYFLLLMCKLRGIRCLAITDHNEIAGAKAYKKFLRNYQIDVIIGEEIYSQEGEIIGLFLTEWIPPGLTASQTIAAIKRQNAVVYIPHPYDEKRWRTVLKEQVLRKNALVVDLIESHNGRNVEAAFSARQQEIASSVGKTAIVGSDAHTFLEIGRNYIYVKPFATGQELLRNMQEAVLVKRPCLRGVHLLTKAVKLYKLLRKGDLHGIYRVVIRKFSKSQS